MNQPRDNAGALFKNQRKQRESQPDYQGEAMVNGHAYYLSAWIRKSAQGMTFMSIAFKGKATPPPYHAPTSAYQGQQKPLLPVNREPGSDDDKGEEPPP